MNLDVLPRGSIAVMRSEGGPRSNGNEDAKPMGDTPPNSQKGEAEAPSQTEEAKRRCPECGEELDYLECYTGAKYYYDGKEFEYVEMAPADDDDYLFMCPYCDAELAWSVEEATAILKPKEGA